jgi:hypothetical protein
MNDLRRPKDGLSGTDLRHGNFPIGSLENRAAARARLEQPDAPDICFIVVKAGPRDAQGRLIANFQPQIAWASCEGVRYDRLPRESVDELKGRVLAGRPLTPQIVVLRSAPLEIPK